jgi:hypothetical protein
MIRTRRPHRASRAGAIHAWVLGGAVLTSIALAFALGGHSDRRPPDNASAFPTEQSVVPHPVPRSAAADERPPDLDQEEPSELEVRTVPAEGRPATHRLGFRSAVRNVGAGPLIVQAARPSTSTPTMRVDQVIERPGATPRVVAGVGRMEYAESADHSHWHYLQFERYELQRFELRRADGSVAIVTDRKTGFCLGDRYRVKKLRLRAAAPKPVFTGGCGLMRPDLLRMSEGISVGYGDDYSAFLEGQDLPLDGLAAGRYLLVHRVNVDRRLHEASYANNSSSALLELRWQNGTPIVRTIAVCPDTDRCGR